jgi:hypothetical protein
MIAGAIPVSLQADLQSQLFFHRLFDGLQPLLRILPLRHRGRRLNHLSKLYQIGIYGQPSLINFVNLTQL